MALWSGRVCKLALMVGIAAVVAWLPPALLSWTRQWALAEIEQSTAASEVCVAGTLPYHSNCATNARDAATALTVDVALIAQAR